MEKEIWLRTLDYQLLSRQKQRKKDIADESKRLNDMNENELKAEADKIFIEHDNMTREEVIQKLLKDYQIYLGYGEGKRTQKGKGFFGDLYKSAKEKINKVKDKITDVKDKIVKFFQPRLDSYNNKTRKNLEKYGNIPISSIDVMREPISSYINTFLNGITFGGWDDAKKKVGYDDMFHLGMVVTLDTGVKIKVEKNDN